MVAEYDGVSPKTKTMSRAQYAGRRNAEGAFGEWYFLRWREIHDGQEKYL